MIKVETRGVLAGAYRAKNPKSFLRHAVEVDANGFEIRVLCNRVELDNLADSYAIDPAEPVTCKTCARRDPRKAAG